MVDEWASHTWLRVEDKGTIRLGTWKRCDDLGIEDGKWNEGDNDCAIEFWYLLILGV